MGVPNFLSESPVFGFSTLMTSAPNSLQTLAAKGAATNVARSIILIPDNGKDFFLVGFVTLVLIYVEKVY